MVFPHSYRSAILLICEVSSSIVSPAVHDFFWRRQTMSSRRHLAQRPEARPSSVVTHFTLTLRQFAHALLCRTVFINCVPSSSPLTAEPVVFCRFLGWSDCSGEDPRSPCRWFIVCLSNCRALDASLKPCPSESYNLAPLISIVVLRSHLGVFAWGSVFCRAAVPSPRGWHSTLRDAGAPEPSPLDFWFNHSASREVWVTDG